jgi:NADH dehydrogenase
VTTQVVVIGAGFGGLAAVKGLRDAPVHVTLVDANNFHTFQPLLYQVATAGLDVDDVATRSGASSVANGT